MRSDQANHKDEWGVLGPLKWEERGFDMPILYPCL